MIYHFDIAGKGGITQYTFNLVSHLNKSKYGEKAVIVSSYKYELEKLSRNFTVHYLFNQFKTNPVKILKFFYSRINRNDIVHFQLSSFPLFVLLMLYLIKYFRGSKVVVTVHNVISHEEYFATKLVLRKIYNFADRLIVHAEQNRNELIEYFNVYEKKIKVVFHGNYQFANEMFNESLHIRKTEEFNILFFGFIREYKGLDTLIQATRKVVDRFPNVVLNIAGQPKESFERYQNLIDKLNLSKKVGLFLEYISFESIQEFFHKADVVVLPYKRISQSGIVFMAYAFGRPVISTNVGGLPEVVEHNKSGYVVDPENPDKLAEAIIRLIKDPKLKQKFGIYAKELSEEKYSWTVIAANTIELYKSLKH